MESHILYIYCWNTEVLGDKGNLYVTYYENLTVSCVTRSSVYGTKVPRAGFNTDIAGTGHREVKHLTASTSPVFQGPSYNLSSLTQQLLSLLTLL